MVAPRSADSSRGDTEAGALPRTPVPDGIYVSSSDGSRPRRVRPTNGEDTSPAWSPDSKWIVFCSYRNDNYDIWLVGRDGTGLQQVTHGAADDFAPAFLPSAP